MSAHDTTAQHAQHKEPRSKSAFSASFWFVLILVGLFIAAVNFINIMGQDDASHGGGHATQEAPAHTSDNPATETTAPAGAQQAAEGITDSPATEAAHH